jgi:hypothetical protein
VKYNAKNERNISDKTVYWWYRNDYVFRNGFREENKRSNATWFHMQVLINFLCWRKWNVSVSMKFVFQLT